MFGNGSGFDDTSALHISIVPAAQSVSNEESRSDTLLMAREFRYWMPHAQEVFLVWGINGWQPIPEPNRPVGTVIKNSVMHSPMVPDGDTLALKVHVMPGVTVQYGFLVTRMRNGSDVSVWDGADRYAITVSEPGVTVVRSVVVVNWFGDPVDRTGLLMVIVLVVCFIGVVAMSVRLMFRGSSEGPDRRSTAELNLIPPTDPVQVAALITVLFAALGSITLWHHEMWRDELQAWHIAATSSSLRDLFANLRYEGHPALWYVCLYALTRWSDNPVVMQLLHLGLATAVVYLFSRFAPFTKLQKLCFAFGYFPLYEYGIISRSYVLGVLGLFAFCALQGKARAGSLTPAVLLALIANTSAYGAMIALAFGVIAVYDVLTAPPEGEGSRIPRPALLLLIVSLGVAAAIVQMTPPPDTSPRLLKWHTSLDVNRLEWTLAQVWRSYVPVPPQTVSFWNNNILDSMEPVHIGAWQMASFQVQAALSIGLLALAIWMLAYTPVVMLVYVVATAELLLFTQIKYYGGLRHAGHLFIVLVACLWISRLRVPPSYALPGHAETYPFPDDAAQPARRMIRTSIITVLFLAQSIAGLMVVHGEIRFSFSAAKDVARFLTDHHLHHLTMIGSKYYVASAVALYLNQPMYYPEPDHYGIHNIWKAGRHRLNPRELVRKAEDIASQQRENVVLVLDHDLGPEGNGLIKIGTFQDNVISDERYVLYLACHAKAAKSHAARPASGISEHLVGRVGDGFCS